MPIAYINIGSNKGNRIAHIEQAVALIELLCNSIAQRSPIIESEPWGFESQHQFLNIGIAIETHIEPTTLLKELLNIEKKISEASHRDENGNYIDRKIDIDLIAVDDIIIDSPHLQLPHPRMQLRNFVLAPMMHLNHNWTHPILNQSINQLYLQLNEKDN